MKHWAEIGKTRNIAITIKVSAAMEVTYKLHGVLKSQAEKPFGQLPLPENSTIETLMAEIEKIEPSVSFQKVITNVAVNQTLVLGDERLANGDEVSFIPPIAGG